MCQFITNKRLETIQNKVGRICLGTNKEITAKTVKEKLSWSSFEEGITNGKIKFAKKDPRY